MPIIVAREKQPDNTIRTFNAYQPMQTSYIPMYLLPDNAAKAVEDYRALLADWHKFGGEQLKAVNVGEENKAKAADKADARSAVESGRSVKPNKHYDAYKVKEAEYDIRAEVFMEKLVEAERAVEDAINALGDDGLIQRALDIAQERADMYSKTTAAMLAARDPYNEAMSGIGWAVARSAAKDKTQAFLPPGAILPPVVVPHEPLDVTAILNDSKRHKLRLDVVVGRNTKDIVNAARRFMYARLPIDPEFDPAKADSGARRDRFID